MKKSGFLVFFIFGLFVMVNGTAVAKTYYVPDNFPTIQRAINAAYGGDRIIVRSGTYKESVTVNKSLTIQSETGFNNTIIESPSHGSHTLFNVTAKNVIIMGFTLKYAYYGIYLDSNSCSILNNYFYRNHCGITVWYSDNITFNNNILDSNYSRGVYAVRSRVTITNNEIKSNGAGIYMSESCGTISGNNITGHGDYGIGVSYSRDNLIKENIITSNNSGIFFDYSGPNTINNNTISSNGIGINIWRSADNTIASNMVEWNDQMGINLYKSSNNQITCNTIKETNDHGGIHLHDSSCYNTV